MRRMSVLNQKRAQMQRRKEIKMMLARRKTAQAILAEKEEEIEKRIARAEYELSFADKFDTVIIDDELDVAKRETLSVINHFIV